MEPDDRIALSILAELVVPAERVLFIGTSLLNSRRKAKLARHQLKSTALCSVPVYAGILLYFYYRITYNRASSSNHFYLHFQFSGIGKSPSQYPQIISSETLTYNDEGKGIIPLFDE